MKSNEISDILNEMNAKYAKSSMGLHEEEEDAGLDINYLVSSSSKKRKEVNSSKMSNRKQPMKR